MTINIRATLDTEQARLVALQGAATGYNRFLINAALDVIADLRQQPNETDADYGRRMVIAAQNAEPGTWAADFWPDFGTAVTVDTGTTVPAPSSGSASVSSIPTSLAGTGAIALTQATHAGKTLHAEPGQTSLTIAAADWADGGECSVINHTGAVLPITIGTGLTGFDNAKGGQSVVGPATVLVLAYLERAIIQVKDGQFVNVAKVSGGEREEGWALSTYYRQGAIVRAPSASGTIGAGDRIIRNTAGTSAATFAADAANWTEIAEDPDSMPVSTAALAVKGNATNATANATDIAAGTDGHVLRRSGTALGFGTIATAGVADNAVTNAKLADMPANTAMVNNTAATADPVNLAITANQVLGRNSTGNLTGLAVTDVALTVLDDTTIVAMRTTLGAAASASPALTGDMTLTDTVAGLGPVLKLENDSFVASDKARLAFEHGTSQNYQAFIQSNLPGSNDVDLEFFTTNGGVLNTTAALRLTGNNTVELAAALPLLQGGTGATTAEAARIALGASSGDAGTVGTLLTISSVIATWGQVIPVDAAAGNMVVTLPASVTADGGKFIRILRRDTSANTVQVVAAGAETITGTGHTGAQVITLNVGGSVTFRCSGTQPELKDWSSPGAVSRLWLPDDASTDPVIWYNFRNLASLTFNVLGVSAMTNLGTLGATHNLTQSVAASQPQINSTTAPLYATFDGGDRLVTASADSIQNGTIGSMGVAYTQAAQRSSSLYAQNCPTGGQLNIHPKWSDGNTYLDMPITSARISGNIGTALAGDANDYAAVGIRNGANINLYARGNQTASLTSAAVSGTSTGSAVLNIGSSASTDTHIGRIYEFVYYRIALTNDERDRLAAYLLWGSGGQAQIHTSNPYRNARPLVAL